MEQLIYLPFVLAGVYVICSLVDRKPQSAANQPQNLPMVDAERMSEIHFRMAAAPENAKKNLDAKTVEKACTVFKLCTGRDPKEGDVSKISTIYPMVFKPKKKPVERQLGPQRYYR